MWVTLLDNGLTYDKEGDKGLAAAKSIPWAPGGRPVPRNGLRRRDRLGRGVRGLLHRGVGTSTALGHQQAEPPEAPRGREPPTGTHARRELVALTWLPSTSRSTSCPTVRPRLIEARNGWWAWMW